MSGEEAVGGGMSALQAKAAKMVQGRPPKRVNEKLEAAIQKRGTLSADEIRAKYSSSSSKPQRFELGSEDGEEESDEESGGTSPVKDKNKKKNNKEEKKKQRQQQSTASVNTFQSSIDDPPHKQKVVALFFVVNTFFSVMVAATGALGIFYATVNTYNAAFLGFYMVLLAFVLVMYEVAQLSSKFERLDSFLLKNIGFLYGPMGKSAYLVFMAVLAFGIESPREVAISTGVLVVIWAAFQCGASWKYPDYFFYKEKFVPEIVEGEPEEE